MGYRMAEDGALGGSRQEMVERFTRIPGLGRSRAETIYDAGYTNIGLLRKSSVEELTKIPGIGISLARCVMNNLDRLRDEAGGAAPATGATTPASAPAGTVLVGGPAAAEPKPEAPAIAAGSPAAAQPAQSRGFLSSIFDKILGKPVPAQPAGVKKEPENKEPEKKEIGKKEPDASEGVKVEAAPDSKKEGASAPGEGGEPEKKAPETRQAPGPVPAADEKTLPESPADPKPAAPDGNDIKVEGKPDGKAQDKM